jgi:DDE superfamily endonuclease
LCHLDEAGFAPTLPATYSWSVVGERLEVPYEAPEGRRVNALGAYFSHGPEAGEFHHQSWASLPKSRAKQQPPTLAEQAAAHQLPPEEVGRIDSERLLAFIWRIAGRPAIYSDDWRRERPLVIALDNYSVHKSQEIKAAQPALAAANVTLWYLPAYRPEMSEMEPIWHAVKHRELVKRSHEVLGGLKREVDDALARKAAALRAARSESADLRRRAA